MVGTARYCQFSNDFAKQAMVTLVSVVHVGSSIILASALLAIASEKPFSGSGPSGECSPEHTYKINSCGPPLNSDCDFGSLSRTVEEKSILSNNTLCINVNISNVLLRTNVTFVGLESLIINGNPDLNVTIDCQTGTNKAGITFQNISRLVLRNLIVTNCGILHGVQEGMYRLAVTILHSRRVAIERLVALKSFGIGLMIIDHQGGTAHVESSKFLDNRISKSDSDVLGSGGVYVGGFKHHPSEPITFKFENCTFE